MEEIGLLVSTNVTGWIHDLTQRFSIVI